MRILDCLTDVENIAALGTTRRDVLRRGLQQLLDRYASAWPWPHYRARGSIQTIDDLTTDTVNVTNGSRTVTKAAGTDWPASVAGRKFRAASEQQWYDIDLRDSATQITLLQPYQGSTQSGIAYTIFQDEYRLAANCTRPLDMIQLEDRTLMLAFPYLDFDDLFTDVGTLSDPLYLTVVGRRDDRYTTGNIQLAANSRTLTGLNAPSWTTVEGLGDGSKLAVEDTSEEFTVRSVDTATQITAYEAAAAAESSSAYRIYLNNIRVQVRDIPDAARNLYYRYQRRPFLPVRDFDQVDAPVEHHGMIKEGLLSLARQIGTTATPLMAQYHDAKFKAWLAEQIREIGRDWPMPVAIKGSMDAGIGDFPRLRLPNTYGIPLWR